MAVGGEDELQLESAPLDADMSVTIGPPTSIRAASRLTLSPREKRAVRVKNAAAAGFLDRPARNPRGK